MHAQSPWTVVVALSLGALAWAQPCEPGWQPGFAVEGPYQAAHAIVAAAPAGREAIFVGGDFTETMHGIPLSHIASFDGERWLDMDGGVDGPVRALAAWDPDGAGPQRQVVVAAGDFSHAGLTSPGGMTPAGGVAIWDGASWSGPGGGVPGDPMALGVVDVAGAGTDELFVSSLEDGEAVVRRLSGESWLEIGRSPGEPVQALASWDRDGPGMEPPRLVAAAGGRVRLWDGAAWHDLPSTAGRIRHMVEVDLDGHGAGAPHLLASVSPTSGREWLLLAIEPGGAWRTLAAAEGAENVGTELLPFDPDGSGPLPPGVFYVSEEPASQHYLSTLQFYGDWPGWEPLPFGALHYDFGPTMSLSFWQRTESRPVPEVWIATESLVSRGSVLALDVRDRIAVFPGGGAAHDFRDVDVLQQDGVSSIVAATIHGLMRHEDGAWRTWATPDGSGGIYDLLVDDPDGPGPADGRLYASGTFQGIAGVPAGGAAVWADGRWSALGTGPQRFGELATLDLGAGSRLYGSGSQLTPGRDSVAVWDGAAWETVGATNGSVRKMIEHDPDGAGPAPNLLVVVGTFTQVDDVDATGVALFDGARWAPADPGYTERTYSVASHDPDGPGPLAPQLYVRSHEGLYRLGSLGFEYVTGGEIGDLISFDPDGGGPLLPQLIGGFDGHANGLARLERDEWVQHLGGLRSWRFGMDLVPGHGRALASLAMPSDGGTIPLLAVTGEFSVAGDELSYNVAFWSGACPCEADCDGSGALDFFDFLCFQNRFAAADPSADCDGSGALDFFDFLCFQNAFAAGCP